MRHPITSPSARPSWTHTRRRPRTGSPSVSWKSLKLLLYSLYVDHSLPFADGDLGGYANAKTCYMKQKHRLIWERRHGPVGSGMKGEEQASEDH